MPQLSVIRHLNQLDMEINSKVIQLHNLSKLAFRFNDLEIVNEIMDPTLKELDIPFGVSTKYANKVACRCGYFMVETQPRTRINFGHAVTIDNDIYVMCWFPFQGINIYTNPHRFFLGSCLRSEKKLLIEPNWSIPMLNSNVNPDMFAFIIDKALGTPYDAFQVSCYGLKKW